MKFQAVTTELPDTERLRADYQSAREIGVLRVGESCLFIKRGRALHYIPYQDVRRCFRRVQLIPAGLCCGKGEIPLENLVVCGDAGELAQVQLPGTMAAKVLMEILRERLPDAEFTVPGKTAKEREEGGAP